MESPRKDWCIKNLTHIVKNHYKGKTKLKSEIKHLNLLSSRRRATGPYSVTQIIQHIRKIQYAKNYKKTGMGKSPSGARRCLHSVNILTVWYIQLLTYVVLPHLSRPTWRSSLVWSITIHHCDILLRL